MKDLKESLSGRRKPDITHVRVPFMIYTCRPCEYGDVKYERANFLRPAAMPAKERQRAQPMAANFIRLREYARAAMSHLALMLDALEQHESMDPNLLDVAGMLRAAYAIDRDATPGAKVGASNLPHLAAVCSSLNMAITQAVRAGLLPPDPGQPWAEALDENGDPPALAELIAHTVEVPAASRAALVAHNRCIPDPVFDLTDVEPKVPRASDDLPDPAKADHAIPPGQF